jgi:hypothetical protein
MTIIEITRFAVNGDMRKFAHPRLHFPLYVRNEQYRYDRMSGGYMRSVIYTLDAFDVMARDWEFVAWQGPMTQTAT